MSRSITPAAAHKPGEHLNGFVIDAVTEITDFKARAYRARHLATGAEVLAVHANDEENLFSVGFRTPPPDSTGVAHILEHSVLAGSDKYPVKDAFNELGKRTLNTFLNAMTWPDRTIYPTCSTVRADYFNLAAVYCDLVFHPRLAKSTFLQEGHHLELEDLADPSSPLKVTGVVYNEMKGAYSAPEQVAMRASQRALLPDTPYAFDSGGDPEEMPDLTYEDFVRFHRRYYSPSNARFMLYGDIPLRDNLAFLEGVLAGFDRVEINSEIPPQPKWTAPLRSEILYPVGPTDPLEGKTFVTLNWMGPETNDPIQSLLLDVLGSALYGTAAGPLRKALIDSGLGKDVFPGSAYDEDIRVGVFSCGLRGCQPDDADKIEALILDTLARVAESGLDREQIEASFHQVELNGREIVPPFPVQLLVRANPSWYFGGDPVDGLRFGALVGEARERWRAEPRLFENEICKWLLDNPHRLRLVCRPSNTLTAERDAAAAEKLRRRKQAMSPAQVDEVVREARELKSAQQAPEDPAAIATLPQLDMRDIPSEPRTIASRAGQIAGAPAFEHEVFSNGVCYVGLSFDLRGLSDEEAIWLPLMCRATTGMGAAGRDYEQMATRIARYSGGFSPSLSAGRRLREENGFERLDIDTSMLARNAGELFAIMGELLREPDTKDLKRLGDLTREAGSRAQSRIVPSGHAFAMLRAAAAFGREHWRKEQWSGATQVRFLNDLLKRDDAAAFAERIASLQSRLFTRSRLSLDLAGDPELLDLMRPMAESFVASLPDDEPVAASEPSTPGVGRASGVVVPAEVNYVAQVLPVPDQVSEAAPALDLMARVLSNDFLYQKLRVQGGAYGGMCFYQGAAGLMTMLSYRDPHLEETFEVFDEAVAYLKENLSDEAVDASRMEAVAPFHDVMAPSTQLAVARDRRIRGVTDEDRRRHHSSLLSLSADRIREAALPHLDAGLANASRAAFGGKERLEKANRRLNPKLDLATLES